MNWNEFLNIVKKTYDSNKLKKNINTHRRKSNNVFTMVKGV